MLIIGMAAALMSVSSEGIAATGEVNRSQPSFTTTVLADADTSAMPLELEDDPADQLTDPSGYVIIVAALLAVLLFFALRWYRLDRAPPRPRVLAPLPAFALLVAMIVLQLIGFVIAKAVLGIELVAEPGETGLDTVARVALGAYIAQSIGFAIFLHQWLGARRPADDRRWKYPAAAIGGAGALMLFLPVVMVLGWFAALLVTWITSEPPDPVAHETLAMFVASDIDAWFIIMSVLVIVVAPLFEEVMYRGLLQDALRCTGLGPWSAIAVASFVFTFMHVGSVEGHALSILFVLSLGFGWIYEKTGRLTAPIIMHMLFNAFNLIVAMQGAPGAS